MQHLTEGEIEELRAALHAEKDSLEEELAEHEQEQSAKHEQHRRAQILTECDLPLLAGLLPAMGGRFKGFFAGGFGHGRGGKLTAARKGYMGSD